MLLLLMPAICRAEHAVLLVSLGMPDDVLRAYFKQGKYYDIPIVIRGLYTDQQHRVAHRVIGRFDDTARRMKRLIKSSQVGGVSIDPLLFRAFHVEVVPALVIYDEGLTCIKQTNHKPYPLCPTTAFDVIYGNVPLKKLLKITMHRSQSLGRVAYARFLLRNGKETNG